MAWNAVSSLEAQDAAGRFDYAPLDRLLATFVDDAGFVNYAGLKQNHADLDKIVWDMARKSPDNAPAVFPSREAQLAYWIDAYNAEVLRIVVDHYPTSSITRIGLVPFGAFFIERVELGGKKLTLRGLENDIIRSRFHDARIHFAINCASRSCPPLARHAYQPEMLEAQLEDAARAFINDDRQVTLDETEGKVVLSKIFDWYASTSKRLTRGSFTGAEASRII